MNVRRYLSALLLPSATVMILGACGSDDDNNNSPPQNNDAGTPNNPSDSGGPTDPGTAQRPPQGAVNVEAWLKAGSYKSWHSESAIHESRSPSPHGFNRIYSNDLISANATGTQNWPQGAAAVKELYTSTSDTTPVGYAVYLKTQADSADGANWYWYERVPNTGVVADGLGNAGTAKSICVGCHGAAGADGAHTPTPGGRDQVYTPVP